MINYEYLSCTDSDGNVKEINFNPNSLPATADTSRELILKAYPDKTNTSLLHVKQTELSEIKHKAYQNTIFAVFENNKITNTELLNEYINPDRISSGILCIGYSSQSPLPNNSQTLESFIKNVLETWRSPEGTLTGTVTLPCSGTLLVELDDNRSYVIPEYVSFHVNAIQFVAAPNRVRLFGTLQYPKNDLEPLGLALCEIVTDIAPDEFEYIQMHSSSLITP